MTMATRIAVMDRGQIAQIGTPAEVYDRPANRFVADFIGSVNLFEGRVKQRASDHLVVEAPEFGGDTILAETGSYRQGDPIHIALRPEKITIAAKEQALGFPNVVFGTIKDMAYLGDTRIYQIVLSTGKLVKIHTPSFGGYGNNHFTHGDEVQLGWSASAGVAVAL